MAKGLAALSNELIEFIHETAKLSEEQAVEIQNLMANIQILQEVSTELNELKKDD